MDAPSEAEEAPKPKRGKTVPASPSHRGPSFLPKELAAIAAQAAAAEAAAAGAENGGANRKSRSSSAAAGKSAPSNVPAVKAAEKAYAAPEGGKRKLYNPKKATRPSFLVTINDIPM